MMPHTVDLIFSFRVQLCFKITPLTLALDFFLFPSH